MLPRKQYPKVINTELEQIEFEIEKLQNKVDRSNDEAKAEHKVLIDILHSKLEQAKEKLDALEQATEDEWDDVKADLDNTRNALKTMWSDAVSQITG